MVRSKFIQLLMAAVAVIGLTGADWTQFRGTNANSVSTAKNVPTEWGPGKNLAWSSALPGRGLSCPIVVGDLVVVTASSGPRQDQLHVLAFDAGSGELRWERTFWATGNTTCHEKMCVATPTPASDGQRIFATYSSNDLVCLDLEGNLQWLRGLTYDFPNASNSLGMSSSPIVIGDVVVVQVESDAEAFTTGIDAATGIARWKIDRPRAANWTSPTILRQPNGESDLALLQSSKGLSAVDPKSGTVIWSYDDGAATIPSSTVADRTVYVPSNGIAAIRPRGSSDAPEVLWQVGRLSPATASPVADDGRLYVLNRAGVLNCADASNGDVIWNLRLKGPFSSTPVIADGKLYVFNEEGLGQVVQLGAKGELLSENDLGETILCTPAVVDGALYVRSDQHLWKIANDTKP